MYDEEPTRFFRGHEQRIPDVNDVIDPYANFNDLSIPATTGHTRFQPDVQYHEPRPRLLNPTAQEILQAFFNGNPYPETEDKTSLAQLTKIRVSQVENWFRNTRQRQVSHPVSSLLTPPIQEPSCIGQDSASTGQYQVFQQNGRLGDYSGFGFTPIHMEDRGVVASLYGSQGSTGGYDRHRPSLQAYQAVPPRDDVPPVTVSRSVIGFQTTRSLEPTIEDKQRMGRSGGSSTSWAQVPQEADLRSFDMSRESIQVSAASNINSTKPGRQGRRKMDQIKMFPRKRTNGLKIFQCVWCYSAWRTSSEMRRHMETQHAPQHMYICMPEGLPSLRVLDHSCRQMCILCQSVEPEDAHFYASHNALPCLQKHLDNRSFYRKDHLSRHIEESHGKDQNGVPGLPSVVKEWGTPIYGPNAQCNWYCGFCEGQLDDWHKWINHISKHFADGCDMTSWIDSFLAQPP